MGARVGVLLKLLTMRRRKDNFVMKLNIQSLKKHVICNSLKKSNDA